jgi:hypothetical protein
MQAWLRVQVTRNLETLPLPSTRVAESSVQVSDELLNSFVMPSVTAQLTDAPPLRQSSINLPEDFDAPVPKSKRRRLTNPLRQEEMGAQVISRIQKSKKTDQSRPILAAFASYPKKTLEKVTGLKLSNQEFSNI